MDPSGSPEALDELAKWTVGPGILVAALFPLAIPILALTAVGLIPLVLPVVALGLVVAVVAAPVLLVRRGVRSFRDRRGAARPARALQ